VHKVKSLVDAAEGGAVNGLTTDNTTGTNTGGIFTSTTESSSVDEDLDGVLAGEEVDELEGLLDDVDGVLLLTVGAATSDHDGVDEALNNRALDLLELALLVAASGVGDEDLLSNSFDLAIVDKGHVGAFNAFVGPLAEAFGFESEFGSVGIFDERFVAVYFFCHLFKGYKLLY